jgi:hypothetical protein
VPRIFIIPPSLVILIHTSFIPGSPNNTVCNIYNIHYVNYNLAIGQLVLGIIIILMYMCIKSEIDKKQELNQDLTDDEFYNMCGMFVLPMTVIQVLMFIALAHGSRDLGPHIIDYYQRISKFAVIGCNPIQVWLIYASLLITGLPSILIGAVLGIIIGLLTICLIIGSVIYAFNSWARTFTCGKAWCCDLDKCCQEINIQAEHPTSGLIKPITDTANNLPISNSISRTQQVKYIVLPSLDNIEMMPPPYE